MKHLYIWLVVSTPLKNMKASWDDYFQYVYRKITNVPNYQPDRYIYISCSHFILVIFHCYVKKIPEASNFRKVFLQMQNSSGVV